VIVRAQLPEADLERIKRGEYQYDRWVSRLARAAPPQYLTPRWHGMIPHPEQVRLEQSRARFKVCWAGRRSGKTERVKRILVSECLAAIRRGVLFRALVGGPTRDQTKLIYWEDLKALVPFWALDRKRGREGISESTLTIHLLNGVELSVFGMDRPQRAAGSPIDFLVLDEYGDMKPAAWRFVLRPALSTMGRPGRAVFIGSPTGRNHFYDLAKDFAVPKIKGEWDYFTWTSEEIASQDEIDSARSSLDPMSYSQQYRAEWTSPEGRICYAFRDDLHAAHRLAYQPPLPLMVAFDFNNSPGIAVYAQDQFSDAGSPLPARGEFTAVLGEVWIEANSNSEMVARRVVADWGPGGKIAHHQGPIVLYGDPAGGAKTTQAVAGSDWEIIRAVLSPVFGEQVSSDVPYAHPPIRARVNSLNSRIQAVDGSVRLLLDPVAAPHTIHDLRDVTWKIGAAGEIEKDKNSKLTHCFDALGYLVHRKHPMGGSAWVTETG
jgi:hypothetical protein